jgi:hypothetical protein
LFSVIIRIYPVSKYNKIKSWFYTGTWALPLDIFRVIFGFLCIFYFYSLYAEKRMLY